MEQQHTIFFCFLRNPLTIWIQKDRVAWIEAFKIARPTRSFSYLATSLHVGEETWVGLFVTVEIGVGHLAQNRVVGAGTTCNRAKAGSNKFCLTSDYFLINYTIREAEANLHNYYLICMRSYAAIVSERLIYCAHWTLIICKYKRSGCGYFKSVKIHFKTGLVLWTKNYWKWLLILCALDPCLFRPINSHDRESERSLYKNLLAEQVVFMYQNLFYLSGTPHLGIV